MQQEVLQKLHSVSYPYQSLSLRLKLVSLASLFLLITTQMSLQQQKIQILLRQMRLKRPSELRHKVLYKKQQRKLLKSKHITKAKPVWILKLQSLKMTGTNMLKIHCCEQIK